MQWMSDEYFDAKQEVGGISNRIYEVDDIAKVTMFGDYHFEMFARYTSGEWYRLWSIDPVLVGRDWPGIHIEESGTAIEYQQYPMSDQFGFFGNMRNLAPRTEKRPTNR